MSEDYKPFQDFQEDTRSSNGWTFQGITMNRKILQPSSGLICSMLVLSTVLHLITIFIIVAMTRQEAAQTKQSMEVNMKNLSMGLLSTSDQLLEADFKMMEKLKAVEASVKEIKDSDVTAKVRNLQTSVDRVLSDEVLGSLTSDIQRVLIAIGRLAEDARKGNNTTDRECNLGWTHHGQSCYYLSSFLSTWKSAKKDCDAQAANLVVINDEEEMDFLNILTKDRTWWIGLTDVDGEWKWVDGTSYDTTPKFWMSAQPDEWFGHGLGGGEDCAQLRSGLGWNDDHCLRRFPYICEKKTN